MCSNSRVWLYMVAWAMPANPKPIGVTKLHRLDLIILKFQVDWQTYGEARYCIVDKIRYRRRLKCLLDGKIKSGLWEPSYSFFLPGCCCIALILIKEQQTSSIVDSMNFSQIRWSMQIFQLAISAEIRWNRWSRFACTSLGCDIVSSPKWRLLVDRFLYSKSGNIAYNSRRGSLPVSGLKRGLHFSLQVLLGL